MVVDHNYPSAVNSVPESQTLHGTSIRRWNSSSFDEQNHNEWENCNVLVFGNALDQHRCQLDKSKVRIVCSTEEGEEEVVMAVLVESNEWAEVMAEEEQVQIDFQIWNFANPYVAVPQEVWRTLCLLHQRIALTMVEVYHSKQPCFEFSRSH